MYIYIYVCVYVFSISTTDCTIRICVGHNKQSHLDIPALYSSVSSLLYYQLWSIGIVLKKLILLIFFAMIVLRCRC